MKSSLGAICKRLEAEIDQKDNIFSILFQYLSNISYSKTFLKELENDEDFPSFCEFLDYPFLEEPNKSGFTKLKELKRLVSVFVIQLLNHPVLHLKYCATTKIGAISIQMCHLIEENESKSDSLNILYFLKLISVCALCRYQLMIPPEVSQRLIINFLNEVENPQLTAWFCSIISGFCANSESFQSCLLTNPFLYQIKSKVSLLLSSDDECIVCSALSLFVQISPIGDEITSALTASLNFLKSQAPFPLMTILSSMIIQCISVHKQLRKKDLKIIFKMILQSTDITSYTLICLLDSLVKKQPKICSFITETGFLVNFIPLLIHSESFVSVAGCKYLYTLHENNIDIFQGMIQIEGLFSDALFTFLLSANNDEKQESLIIILRFLLKGGRLLKNDIYNVSMSKDKLFTALIRSIDGNNQFLSMNIVHFILGITIYFPKWLDLLKEIISATQFTYMLVSVLSSSKNKYPINDSLLLIRFLLGTNDEFEVHYLELLVSSFHMRNTRNPNDKEFNNKLVIENEENKNLMMVIQELKNQLAKSEKNVVMESQNNQGNQISRELEEIKTKYSKILEKNSELEKENESLQKKLSLLQGFEYETKEKTIQQSNYINNLIQRLQESDQVINAKTLQIYQSNNSIKSFTERQEKLEDSIKTLKDEIKTKDSFIEKLKGDLSIESEKNNNLRCEISQLEEQLNETMILLKKAKTLNIKLKTKSEEQNVKNLNLKTEKSKWEAATKFYEKINESKYQATNEVYPSIH